MDNSKRYRRIIAKEILYFFSSILIGVIIIGILSCYNLYQKHHYEKLNNQELVLKAKIDSIIWDSDPFFVKEEHSKQDISKHMQEDSISNSNINSLTLEKLEIHEQAQKYFNSLSSQSEYQSNIKIIALIIFCLFYPLRLIYLSINWAWKTLSLKG